MIMVRWGSVTELLIFGLMAGESAGLGSGSPRVFVVGRAVAAGERGQVVEIAGELKGTAL